MGGGELEKEEVYVVFFNSLKKILYSVYMPITCIHESNTNCVSFELLLTRIFFIY